MFFSKDLNAREDALKSELPDDIYIPYNAGRRIGMGIELLQKRQGDFTPHPLPYEVSLLSWINTKLGSGGFSSAKQTYTLAPTTKVTSFGNEVTMIRATGSASFTVPSTNRLEGLQITGTSADISGSGTFTIVVNLGDATLNTGYTSLFRPYSFEVYDESNQVNGGPSTTYPFVVDDSINTVQKEIIGVSGGVLTLRVSNLQVYEKWTIVLAF